jgi:hypothetical protein
VPTAISFDDAQIGPLHIWCGNLNKQRPDAISLLTKAACKYSGVNILQAATAHYKAGEKSN